jgi:membrane protease YdiL (CAAX protease family)
MWQLAAGICGVFYLAGKTGVIDKMFERPRYARRKNILRYVVEYPTMSFLILGVLGMLPAVAMGHVDRVARTDTGTVLPGYMATFSVLCWINICEELFFRGILFKKMGQNCGSYIVSAALYGGYWGLLTGKMIPNAPLFGLLGLTYGFATERYGQLELALYKTCLFGIVLIV